VAARGLPRLRYAEISHRARRLMPNPPWAHVSTDPLPLKKGDFRHVAVYLAFDPSIELVRSIGRKHLELDAGRARVDDEDRVHGGFRPPAMRRLPGGVADDIAPGILSVSPESSP
jgi:hypothetical protein